MLDAPGVDADLFTDTYSPRRVQFWLLHYDYLTSLAYAPAANRDRAEWLKREWAVLQSQPGVCACDALDDHPPLPASFSGGSYQAASTSAANIKADLEKAASSLPLEWRSTRTIFAIQDRSREWGVRAAQAWSLREALHTPTIPEPHGSLLSSMEQMARFLGWRPART